MAQTLSEQGTLIIPWPVPAERLGLRANVQVGGRELRPKAEHHLTVFGYKHGKLLLRAMSLTAGLRARIDALATGWDWGIAITPASTCFHLIKAAPADLETVVALADARVAPFWTEVLALLPDNSEAAQALRAPPIPHLTLYTSDPSGKDGIGLNSAAELDAAVARGQAGDAKGLRAVRLPDGWLAG